MSPRDVLTIGLTGGIASGKSEVSRRFEALGIPVIDADDIARELVSNGSELLGAIRAAFGPEALDEAGQLRRDWLRKRIFDNPEDRDTLEGILHPRIREEIMLRRARVSEPYCIVVAPLLFETGLDDSMDRTLVVDADEPTQIARLVERDGITEEDARAALAAQMSRRERRARADDVIENKGTLDDLDGQVQALHERYLSAAG